MTPSVFRLNLPEEGASHKGSRCVQRARGRSDPLSVPVPSIPHIAGDGLTLLN